jgi:hypothetical protein
MGIFPPVFARGFAVFRGLALRRIDCVASNNPASSAPVFVRTQACYHRKDQRTPFGTQAATSRRGNWYLQAGGRIENGTGFQADGGERRK